MVTVNLTKKQARELLKVAGFGYHTLLENFDGVDAYVVLDDTHFKAAYDFVRKALKAAIEKEGTE